MAHGRIGLAFSSSPRRPQPPSSLLLVLLAVALLASTCSCVDADAGASTYYPYRPRRLSTASRFLATATIAKKEEGDVCRGAGRACSAVAGAGSEHLKCCHRACTDVLTSRSHCGACGARCQFGQLCCGGRCTAVERDADNCGACGRACAAGQPCAYAMCGYA